MAHADFVHLRVHSAYSLSEGALKIKDLIGLCGKYEMPAIAVTDTGNLFGAMEFAATAAGAGIQPIIGCQLAVHSAPVAVTGTGAAGSARTAEPEQLVILVQNTEGYRNLLKLVSKSYLESDPAVAPLLDLADLDGRTDGLLCLSGGLGGPVGRRLQENRRDQARAVLEELRRLFPDRLYMELMRHPGGEMGAQEEALEPDFLDFAYELDIPLVATNDCYFADESLYEAHDALLCIAQGRYVSEADRRRVTPDHWFKPASAMRSLFADLPEAVDNTLVIARRCSFLLKKIDPILPAFPTEAGRTEDAELRAQAEEGLRHRLDTEVLAPDLPAAERPDKENPYWERLNYELGVIQKMGFSGYFLIVSDFMKWTRRQNIPVGVRGSGATSLVAWSLEITSLDPLRFSLVFERFLNPERVSMPDFDIDFCQERRDEVIRYVQDKYGADRVAQIITFGKLQARAALRDVGRVLQLPYSQVDRLSKLVPSSPAHQPTLKEALKEEPQLQAACDEDEAVARMMDIAMKIEGLYRHASTHAAGVVIGDRPLDELVPLYRDPRADMPVTQFNMKHVEQAGLVKFDFLGLKTLSVIAKTEDLIRARGTDIDTTKVSFADQHTYRMLGRGESTGVFQLESSGMRDLLRKMQPDRIEDLVALVALYRPGPMDSIPVYIACKHGLEQPNYLHPLLEPILNETFGVMTYQEDVMKIARVLAGYSLGQADLLRRAMGKKIQAEMDKQRVQFLDGAVKTGVPREVANQIFDQAAKFAGYGFNKGHAAAYAVVAYQTAWLKANYPVEFLAASMTLDLGNTDKLNVFRQELVRLEIPLLTPDINRSCESFTVETQPDGRQAIRYALAAVKGVGEQAIKVLVAERTRNGPFKDMFDFARRLDGRVMNKRLLEHLACAGAFDCLNRNRAQVYKAVDLMVRLAHAAQEERESGQDSLFGGAPEVALTTPSLPQVADWDALERLRYEFDAIGFYLSAHPLDTYGKALERLKVVSAAAVAARLARGAAGHLRMAGIIVSRQLRVSRSGNRFAFVQLSDSSGVFEVTVFSELLGTSRELLEPGNSVYLTVEGAIQNDSIRLTAQEIKPLEAVVNSVGEGVSVLIRDTKPLATLKEILADLNRGRNKIQVVVETEALREVEITLPGSHMITTETRARLRNVPGVVEVMDL